MLFQYGRHWWVVISRGIAAIGFGAALLAWPDVSASAMAGLFGAYAIVDGGCHVSGLLTGWRRPHAHLQGWLGTAGVVLGVLALAFPSEVLWLLPAIAARFAISGLVEGLSVRDLRSVTGYEQLLLADGIFMVAFGALAFLATITGMLSLLPGLGILLLINASVLVVCGIKLRHLPRLAGRYRLPIV